MKDKINISQLLKDCPQGMELDCTMYEDVYFDYVDELNVIHCYIQRECNRTSITFNQHGTIGSDIKTKCVIFPKGKTTWEGFVPPCKFKNGDVLVHTQNDIFVMSIYKSKESEIIINTHAIFWDRREGLSVGMQICCYTDSTRLATEEERKKFFQAIKDNGYHWDEESKTLEKLIKPIFKKGDKVRVKKGFPEPRIARIIEDVCDTFYTLVSVGKIDFTDQDNWELVPNKFDINTLKPFESKVLVRHSETSIWMPAIFGGYDIPNLYYYAVGGTWWKYCIPYKGNEHLRGTTADCSNYYKIWE